MFKNYFKKSRCIYSEKKIICLLQAIHCFPQTVLPKLCHEREHSLKSAVLIATSNSCDSRSILFQLLALGRICITAKVKLVARARSSHYSVWHISTIWFSAKSCLTEIVECHKYCHVAQTSLSIFTAVTFHP